MIVGAGLAGLVTAVALHESGIPVRVFEASNASGGRLRTDRHAEGFLIDRGSHLLLTANPAVRRWIDVDRLQPRDVDATILAWTGRRRVPLADPLRHPLGIVRDLTTSLITLGDKLRLARLIAEVATASWQSAGDAELSLGEDVSGSEYLWSRGFSELFVDRFARPLWGGHLLDPYLAGSAGTMLFTVKMLLEGGAVLPAAGIGALPEQLVARLPADAISFDARVTSVVVEDGRAAGVRAGRRKIPASMVVVAADPPAARSFLGMESLNAVQDGLPCTTIYLASERPPRTGARLVIDATRRLVVNHVVPMSSIQPTYAPSGRHLLAAVIVGERALDEDMEAVAEQARIDTATMLGDAPGVWIPLEIVRVPYARYARPPGIRRRLPGNITPIRGLVLASEATHDSSYDGAVTSAEVAAAIVRRELALGERQ